MGNVIDLGRFFFAKRSRDAREQKKLGPNLTLALARKQREDAEKRKRELVEQPMPEPPEAA